MGNKVRANDWTCLLSSGWKRAMQNAPLFSYSSMILPPRGKCGNATEPGDAVGSPGKSSLFFLTGFHPGIRFSGDRV